LLTPRPTPTLEDQASVFIFRIGRVAQLYPQAPGTHFSHLLRHTWATVGLFLFSDLHTGDLYTLLVVMILVRDIVIMYCLSKVFLSIQWKQCMDLYAVASQGDMTPDRLQTITRQPTPWPNVNVL
jgi:hypothetical protein